MASEAAPPLYHLPTYPAFPLLLLILVHLTSPGHGHAGLRVVCGYQWLDSLYGQQGMVGRLVEPVVEVRHPAGQG